MSLNTDVNSYSGDLNNFLNSSTTDRNSFYGGQKNDINDFLTRYRQGIFSQETVPAMNERIGKELNLPTLQQNANTLNTQMANIPSTYTAATRGFDVNANQLGRIVDTKTAAISPAVTAANTAAQNAQDQVNTRVGQYQTQQAKELLPYQSEQSMLTDYQAREATGFTQENSNKLQGYMTKLEQGVALSTEEAKEANDLAIQKLQYDEAVKVQQMKNDAQSNYATVPYDSSIYNTQTGKKTGWG